MKTKSVVIFVTVLTMTFGYHFCKDIFKIGVKDGHQTAVKMQMVKEN